MLPCCPLSGASVSSSASLNFIARSTHRLDQVCNRKFICGYNDCKKNSLLASCPSIKYILKIRSVVKLRAREFGGEF